MKSNTFIFYLAQWAPKVVTTSRFVFRPLSSLTFFSLFSFLSFFLSFCYFVLVFLTAECSIVFGGKKRNKSSDSRRFGFLSARWQCFLDLGPWFLFFYDTCCRAKQQLAHLYCVYYELCLNWAENLHTYSHTECLQTNCFLVIENTDSRFWCHNTSICCMTEPDWVSCGKYLGNFSHFASAIWMQEAFFTWCLFIDKTQKNQWSIHRHQLNAVNSLEAWAQLFDSNRSPKRCLMTQWLMCRRWSDVTVHSWSYLACTSGTGKT